MQGRIAIFENPKKNFLEYLNSLHNNVLRYVPIEQAEIGFEENAKKDDKYRVTQLRWLNETTPALYENAQGMLNHYINKANMDWFGFDLSGVCRYVQHTEYNKGSFYKWHQDSFLGEAKQGMYERKLSFTVQLSDSDAYTGGDLEFMDIPSTPELKEKLRQKGTVIVFPSFLQHRVTEITEGQRHALVGWREGKQWT
tara:strand:+ start:178 stop:768 length:591 start_codon:yes stop_codon:yes gene_type:complete